MSKETGGPAFPQEYEHTKVLVQMQQIGDISAEQLIKLSRQLSGMTLRDYFAAKAMQSLVALDHMAESHVVKQAYEMADSMLKARKQ